ncbi:hypothetical protein BDZ97DRAFT_1769361 [Flammula alnicola]|nr:hypothetical protein BDZ97DRAFT_1769361 [Flammula alnicola]
MDLLPPPMLHNPSTREPDQYRSDIVTRAVRLTQENNIPEALPYAYYCLFHFAHKRFLKDRPGDISWQDKTIILGRERLQSSAGPPLVNCRCALMSEGPTQSGTSWRNTSRCIAALRAYDIWGESVDRE